MLHLCCQQYSFWSSQFAYHTCKLWRKSVVSLHLHTNCHVLSSPIYSTKLSFTCRHKFTATDKKHSHFITEEIQSLQLVLLAVFGTVDESLGSCVMLHFEVCVLKWQLVCKFGIMERILIWIYHLFVFVHYPSFVCYSEINYFLIY